ncbi:amino acid transporter [Zopfochytrium polystomum]|nr:amino acid transporter [Zopfochytrium polystomum]
MAEVIDKDEARLKALGYKQELKRELSTFTNYGVSLSVVCVVAGLTTLFGSGLITGGPVVMVWGWVVTAFFTMMVGLSMAEITSAYPTSGGLYFWAARLSPPEYKPIMSWFTGWFNLCGQLALTCGVFFGLALIIAATISVGTSTIDDDGVVSFTFSPKPYQIVLIHIALCIFTGVVTCFPAKVMAKLLFVSTIVQIQPSSFVFQGYVNETGITSDAWVVLVGLLIAQYTLTGYDASAHVTEETRQADVAGPIGIVLAIGVSSVAGFIYLLALLFVIQDYDGTVGTATGLPIVQVLYDSTGKNWTLFLMAWIILANFFCCYSGLIGNSRMIYAFSRDGAMPLSNFWHQINKTVNVPVNALILAIVVDCILILPYLGNSTAFTAITSITTIGLYISYVIPVICRLAWPERFTPGPFKLGVFSKPIGYISVLWVILITVLFVLPTVNPVTPATMNYACVMVGAVAFGAAFAWVVSARFWFHGPIINVDDADKDAVEVDGTIDLK